MDRRPDRYHFALTPAQWDALADLLYGLDGTLKLPAVLGRTFDVMDEQSRKQDAPWERCPTCKGSGWVEESA